MKLLLPLLLLLVASVAVQADTGPNVPPAPPGWELVQYETTLFADGISEFWVTTNLLNQADAWRADTIAEHWTPNCSGTSFSTRNWHFSKNGTYDYSGSCQTFVWWYRPITP